jgi:group I intron endonuclease
MAQPPEEPRAVIYRVMCGLSGKSYVGQTRQPLAVRWRAHVRYAQRGGDQMALARAIRKYGPNAFEVSVLIEVDLEDADTVESGWIARLGCQVPHGYNLDAGGGVGLGRKHPESRRKLSDTQRARLAAMSVEDRCALVDKMHAAMTPEARSERSRKINAGMTRDQRLDRTRKSNATQTPASRRDVQLRIPRKRRREIALARAVTKTFEQRSAAASKGKAGMSIERHAVWVERARVSMTTVQRRDAAHRGWKTRRARRGDV